MRFEKVFEDLGFIVVAKHNQQTGAGDDLPVDFVVYEVVTWGSAFTRPWLHGSIKWDGCSNWHFDAQDDLMIHFCGPSDTAKLSKLFERLYQMAAEIMPEHAHEFE